MKTSSNIRDYGLGETTKFVTGPPVVTGPAPGPCPYCRCGTTYMIEVPVSHPNLRGRKGTGSYVGCPACPWASPMMMTSARGESK